MQTTSSKGTPDQKIAKEAKVWRALEKKSEGDRCSRDKQRAEYKQRRILSKTIDESGGEP